LVSSSTVPPPRSMPTPSRSTYGPVIRVARPTLMLICESG
jgi:hypothetical protein